jgi:hypothetical protein
MLENFWGPVKQLAFDSIQKVPVTPFITSLYAKNP